MPGARGVTRTIGVFCDAAHSDAPWIFGFYRRISVREASWITWLEFFDDFCVSAFKRGKASIFVLIASRCSKFLVRFPRQTLTLFFCGGFWTAPACRIFIFASEYLNSMFEELINIYSSRGSSAYFYWNFLRLF